MVANNFAARVVIYPRHEFPNWALLQIIPMNATHCRTMSATDTSLLKSLKRGAALKYRMDGEVEQVPAGPWRSDLDALYKLIGCRCVQMVPCTQGWMAHKYELWLDESGACVPDNCNAAASAVFGGQAYGGLLHGCVLVVRCGTIE